MIKQLTMVSPPEAQHYDCTSCGDCCRGRFAIVITPEDRDRIVAQQWSDAQLALGGKPLFAPHGDGFQLAHRADGSCVFLQEDGLCRIHAVHGEAAKPLGCRLYPFRYVPLGHQVRIDVRFDCPATASNLGRPIPVHRPELQQLMKTAVPLQSASLPVPALDSGRQPTWAQLARITETFERVLLDVSLDLTRRIAACVNLADILRQADFLSMKERMLGEFLDDAASHVQQIAVDDALERTEPDAAQRIAFRQLLGVYGRLDVLGEKAQLWRRFSTSLRMLAGNGMVPKLRHGFPEVSFAQIEAARGLPGGGAALALERYLYVRLNSMGFFGRPFYNRSYLDGLSALLLTYPLICWFARAYAAGEALAAPDASCVERAIMVVDHHHGITPVLDLPTERHRTHLLCSRNTLRTLVIWYGS